MGCYLIAWNMKTEGKKVIVKFCGGCNPKYDRVAYWEEIKARAGDAVTWVAADFPRPDGMLLICGCHSVCPLKHYNQADYGFFILVDSDRKSPGSVAGSIIDKEGT
ncbi:MAG TPA: hypothetical protein PK953_09740 [Smithellaceae bacterium]|jgi:hypothetical protein|nr:hypothetical protein [Smithellaceae bacterium]HOH57749.1 hypothetical protein [Smithellaceae bacterium]HPV72342.1 hypothetical protein [Smithellaceae bacterium]HPY07729.1 hypothetical protein [Smithellaceae bacterium]HQC11181.1 hypothetical protein [Smithellaceae bacterium]